MPLPMWRWGSEGRQEILRRHPRIRGGAEGGELVAACLVQGFRR